MLILEGNFKQHLKDFASELFIYSPSILSKYKVAPQSLRKNRDTTWKLSNYERNSMRHGNCQINCNSSLSVRYINR